LRNKEVIYGCNFCAPCRDYYFTDKPKLLADVRSKKFLEAARVAVHTRPCTSSEAAAAAAPPLQCSYWYGTSLATVREVAATGKLCLMSLDTQGAEVRQQAHILMACVLLNPLHSLMWVCSHHTLP
jgi:guanylate kinase